MEKELKKLGLTDNEIKTYNALLDIGECTVGPITKKLKMHRQVVHYALEGLEEKNMVQKITKGRRNHYRIANPNNILENIKEKEQIAKKVASEVRTKLAGQFKGQEIKIYEGEKAYREYLLKNDENAPPESEILIVSGSVNRYMDVVKVSQTFEKSEKIRNKKKIKTKVIYDEKLREGSKIVNRKFLDIRFIMQESNPPVAFVVWAESVGLFYLGEEIFFIDIKNEEFRRAYINYFNLLWKTAKK